MVRVAVIAVLGGAALGAGQDRGQTAETQERCCKLEAIDVFGSRKVSDEEVLKIVSLPKDETVRPGGREFMEAVAQAEERLRDTKLFAWAKISPISFYAGPYVNKVYLTVDL